MWTCSAILLAAAALAAEPADGEKAFRTYADFAVGGTWTATIEGVTVENSYRWIVNKQFVELTAKGGLLDFVGIIGVDSKTKKCFWWFYNDDGGRGKDVMTQEADGVWMVEGKGGGPKGEIRFKGRITRVDANTLKLEALESVVFGKKQGEGTSIWKRKP